MVHTIVSVVAVLAMLLLAGNAVIIGCAAILEFAPHSHLAEALSAIAKVMHSGK